MRSDRVTARDSRSAHGCQRARYRRRTRQPGLEQRPLQRAAAGRARRAAPDRRASSGVDRAGTLERVLVAPVLLDDLCDALGPSDTLLGGNYVERGVAHVVWPAVDDL